MDCFYRYSDEGIFDDCPVCHGLQFVPNERWEIFFEDNPDIDKAICEHFGVTHWTNLPHFTTACPGCFDDEVPF